MQGLEQQMSNRESNHQGRELGCWKQCAIQVRRPVGCVACVEVSCDIVIAALLKQLSSPINDDTGDHSLPRLPHILSCGTVFRSWYSAWAPKTRHLVAGRGAAMCVHSSRLRTRCREATGSRQSNTGRCLKNRSASRGQPPSWQEHGPYPWGISALKLDDCPASAFYFKLRRMQKISQLVQSLLSLA